MPLRSRYRRRRTTRRPRTGTTFGRRPLRRTRRTFRRRRPMMSRRRILNVTSEKKQDNMTQFVPTDVNTPGGAGLLIEQVINSNGAFLFCPNARPFQTTQNDESDRNSKNTFARGYKEVSVLRLSGGIPWRRRRICFTMKGLTDYMFTQNTAFVDAQVALQTSQGMVRQQAVLTATNNTALQSLVFQGAVGQDWVYVMDAKTDSTRIKVLSDTMVTINPGNQTGNIRTLKQWYPLNKTLVYNDDESGAGTTSSQFSTRARPGMGDFFIYDIYEQALIPGSGVTSELGIHNQGTYYWHER